MRTPPHACVKEDDSTSSTTRTSGNVCLPGQFGYEEHQNLDLPSTLA